MLCKQLRIFSVVNPIFSRIIWYALREFTFCFLPVRGISESTLSLQRNPDRFYLYIERVKIMTTFTREKIVKNYAINTYLHNGRKLLMVESLITGDCDYPIVWPDGRIAYEHPEYWPKYFKAAIDKFLSLLNK